MKSLLNSIITLHNQIRDAVVATCEQASLESVSSIIKEEEGDTIYAIDRVSEELLLEFIEREIAVQQPIVLIAEGLPGGKVVLPENVDESDAIWRVIIDPIDGTRGLMYQKRSAWILTGIAPNKGPQTNLQDIELAVQTEIPLVKQYLSDQIWVIKGQGVSAVRHNRLSGEDEVIYLHPSRSPTIAHGFAAISRFFPGARDELAAIDEEIVLGALGPVKPGKAHCFEDQYICSGGQLYELMAGHDRFIADLRPTMETFLARKGLALGICCHPYDVCTELIARELGVIITDEYGELLCSPLTVDADVSWVGYANGSIRKQIEPLLMSSLLKRGLIGSTTVNRG
ncbi:MAG: inositol monophosphatase [Candidatus Promineifilaceae bacterium]